MRNRTILLAAAMFLSAASSVHAKFEAGQVNVSFGNKDQVPDGKAAIGADGDKWNTPDGATGDKLALTDAKGEKSDVILTFAGTGTYDADDAGFVATPFEKLLRKYLFSNGPSKVTLTGLTAGAKYDVYVYSASNADGRKTKFTVGSDTKTTTYVVDKKELAEDVNYEKFTATADADGKIELTYDGDGGEGNLNGLQIAPAK